MARKLSKKARAFIGVVLALGAGAGVHLVSGMELRPGDWMPITLFCILGMLASAVSITYHGNLPTRITHQIGSAFAYPLLILGNPGAVCIVFCVMAIADKWFNHRKWLSTSFNMAQLTLATWIAAQAMSLVYPRYGRLDRLDSYNLGAALFMIAVFAVVNFGLTQAVASLANRRPFIRWTWFTRTGVLNETLCIVSGLGMAVFWQVNPWLVSLGIVPIWTLILMIATLNRREQILESREAELRSLQGLGLELGSELDEDRLRETVLRIACDALDSNAAVLGPVEDGPTLVVAAQRGLPDEPPERIDLGPLDRRALEKGRTQGIDLLRERRARPEFRELDIGDLLAAPLSLHRKGDGLLVLLHGFDRRPFDAADRNRLDTLVRFINVAMNNARLVADLTQARSQLIQSEKLSALGMLVSGVAHELNNPLTSVLGFAGLLSTREQDPRKRKMAERIGTEAKRAGRIVQNLLTFSRKHKPQKRAIDLNQIVDSVLDFRTYELKVRNISVDRRLMPGLPRVMADPHQIHQVLLNLVTNAEQAIDDTNQTGCISVETSHQDGAVRIVVSDSGSGITPEDLHRVFLPFFTTKEVGRGTGLGLSLCYGIVEEHGGRIEVSSPPGSGATFTVEIPVAEGESVSAETAVGATVGVREAARPGRLLVVDDEEAIIDLLVEYFESRGWIVAAAQEGTKALDAVRESEFDVLVVDLRMPGMDGRTFFEHLREDRPEMTDRVIFATGDAGSAASAKFLDQVGNVVLHKPYDLARMSVAVDRVLRERRESGGA